MPAATAPFRASSNPRGGRADPRSPISRTPGTPIGGSSSAVAPSSAVTRRPSAVYGPCRFAKFSSQRGSRSGATSTHCPPPAAGRVPMTVSLRWHDFAHDRPHLPQPGPGGQAPGGHAMTELVRPLSDEGLDRLVRIYDAAREPERAVRAAGYMRDQFAFLGFSTPTQRALGRTAVAGLPAPTEDELRTVVLACWGRDEREYQYF